MKILYPMTEEAEKPDPTLRRGARVFPRRGGRYTRPGLIVSREPSGCRLESCHGGVVSVRWPNGQLTRPCVQGMTWDKRRKAWRIG